MTLAGTPATKLFAGTSFVTTTPAPTTEFSPTVTPPSMVTAVAIQTFFSITIGLAVDGKLVQLGVQLLRVTTTNDNLDALRFYQRRGFRIVALRPGPVDESRKIKSTIPVLGEYGIPIRDEIELELLIERRSQESESRSR